MASLQSHFLTPSLPSFPILSLPQQSLLPKLPRNFISNHHIHTFNPKFPSTKKMSSFLTTKASTIEIVASLVQSNPATWQSAIVSNAVIFVLCSPVLVSGLSVSGIVSAFLLGTLTWRAFGFSGFVLVATYFVLGTVATKVKMAQKEAQGIAEKKKGRRGPASVIGSSAAGCVCACLSIYGIGGKALSQLWQLGFVASFCTKLSDTVSSEIGKAYGKTTYVVTTFKIVPRGTEGAVSVEGTLAGVLASILLACVACLTDQGTAATKVKMAQKESEGVAEKRKGRREPASVIGSSAAGCVCAILSIYGIGGKALSQLWQLGFVASFCTKLSDTVSSEIGKAYGNTTYLVTTFKIVPRGTKGAVSVEGTLAGVLASIVLACVGCLTGQINTTQAVVCVLASQIANFGESFIGATIQEMEGFQWI